MFYLKRLEVLCKLHFFQTRLQSNQNFEWIVVDGKSTDGTLDILSKYQKRINILISEEDNGVYFAMNKGIKQAHGKYLLFMNGGDLFYNEKIVEMLLPYLEKEKADVFYGDSYRLFENEKYCFIKTYPDKLTKSFFLTNTLAHQSSFIKKELFESSFLSFARCEAQPPYIRRARQ